MSDRPYLRLVTAKPPILECSASAFHPKGKFASLNLQGFREHVCEKNAAKGTTPPALMSLLRISVA